MSDATRLLEDAIEAQQYRMRGYEKASEAITLEVLRALDFAYCRELIPELGKLDASEQQLETIRRYGVNEALRRVMPTSLQPNQPKLFRSNERTAEQADEFLVDAGMLALAERQLQFVRAGILDVRLDGRKIMDSAIIVLSVKDETAYREQVGAQSISRLSEQIVERDRSKERNLEERHLRVLPHIVDLLRGKPTGSQLPFDEDEYFHEWAVLYLRRLPFSDLLGDDDRLGGRPYSDYLKALTALSAMSQQRLCYAALMNADDPRIGVRNPLTGGVLHAELVEALSNFLDADLSEMEVVLDHLSLSPRNRQVHLDKGTPALAPVVRTSQNFCVLPSYGLEINPFIFLCNELRARYERDWFDAANKREARWIRELRAMFLSERWTCGDGIKLKQDGKVITDIDFAAYDRKTKCLLLFQLKWQQPSANDQRACRSNASNLVDKSNEWVDDLYGWIKDEGIDAIKRRLEVNDGCPTMFYPIVLGRYHAHFTGKERLDTRAVWADWGHFVLEYQRQPDCSASMLIDGLRAAIEKAMSAVTPESVFLRLPDLAVVINPVG